MDRLNRNVSRKPERKADFGTERNQKKARNAMYGTPFPGTISRNGTEPKTGTDEQLRPHTAPEGAGK